MIDELELCTIFYFDLHYNVNGLNGKSLRTIGLTMFNHNPYMEPTYVKPKQCIKLTRNCKGIRTKLFLQIRKYPICHSCCSELRFTLILTKQYLEFIILTVVLKSIKYILIH